MRVLTLKLYLHVFSVIIPLLLVGGCSKQIVPPIATLDAQRAPASVAVLSERRINDRLELLIQLDPVVVWPAAGISVEVTALNEGEEISTRSISPNTIDGLLRPGTPVMVPISIVAEQMTDYRLDVKWGAYGAKSSEDYMVATVSETIPEAPGLGENIRKSIVGEVLLADSTLAVIEPQCEREPCSIAYRYSAKLQNRTERTINSVTLAAHFKAASGEVGEATELEVNELKMAPGEQRPIRVTFDAPELAPGVARLMTPTLEIVSFE